MLKYLTLFSSFSQVMKAKPNNNNNSNNRNIITESKEETSSTSEGTLSKLFV